MSSWCPDGRYPTLQRRDPADRMTKTTTENTRMSSSQSRRSPYRRLRNLVPGAAAFFVGLSPAAADLTVQPTGTVGYEYNTNRNFAEDSDEERKTHGGYARVGLDIINRSPRGELRARPELRFATYRASDDRNETTDDQYLRLDGRYRWQTADAGFVANYAREALLTSELEDVEFPDEDFDLPPDPDTGLVTFRGQRQRIVLRPFVNWDYSELLSFRGEYTLQDVSFSGADEVLRSDFTNHRVTATGSRNMSPLSTLGLQVGVGRFKSDARDNSTDSVFGGLVYDYRWTERTSVQLTGGAERVDASFDDPDLGRVDDKSTGVLLRARLTHETELARWRAEAGRSFEPDGRGFMRRRNEVRLNMQRDVTQRTQFAGGVRWVEWKSASGTGELLERDYFIADAGFDWRWTQTLTVGTRLEYRYQDRNEVPGTADAWSARVQLSYRGLGPAPR